MRPEEQLAQQKILSANKLFLLDLDVASLTHGMILHRADLTPVREALPDELSSASLVLAELRRAFGRP